MMLLRGKFLVKETPYIPQENDPYYYIDAFGCIQRSMCVFCTKDLLLINAGMCYKTEEKAKKHIDKNLKILWKNITKESDE